MQLGKPFHSSTCWCLIFNPMTIKQLHLFWWILITNSSIFPLKPQRYTFFFIHLLLLLLLAPQSSWWCRWWSVWWQFLWNHFLYFIIIIKTIFSFHFSSPFYWLPIYSQKPKKMVNFPLRSQHCVHLRRSSGRRSKTKLIVIMRHK